LFIEPIERCHQKLLEITNQQSYNIEINTQIPEAFAHPDNEQSEKQIKKGILPTITAKKKNLRNKYN
jgi:hypothetical protein